MRLKCFRHLWGYETPWEAAFPEIRALGYAGVETLLPAAEDEARLVDLLKQHELEFVVTVHTQGASVQQHLLSLTRQAERAKKLGGQFVAAQAGSDAFDGSQVSAFYNEALNIEAGIGLTIAHETHRGRPLFHPWSAARIVDEFPALKIVCDFSHWVCVCERLLADARPLIEKAAARAHHIHARVGHAQGPQVSDPREPMYLAEVEVHEEWWDIIWDSQERRGFSESTLCPEFGPAPYQIARSLDSNSYELAATLERIVEWQHRRQVARFAQRTG